MKAWEREGKSQVVKNARFTDRDDVCWDGEPFESLPDLEWLE